MALLPRLFKGFLYGNVVGIFAGVAIYLLAGSASGFFGLGVDPAQLGGFIYAAGVVGGVGMEYARWMEKEG